MLEIRLDINPESLRLSTCTPPHTKDGKIGSSLFSTSDLLPSLCVGRKSVLQTLSDLIPPSGPIPTTSDKCQQSASTLVHPPYCGHAQSVAMTSMREECRLITRNARGIERMHYTMKCNRDCKGQRKLNCSRLSLNHQLVSAHLCGTRTPGSNVLGAADPSASPSFSADAPARFANQQDDFCLFCLFEVEHGVDVEHDGIQANSTLFLDLGSNY